MEGKRVLDTGAGGFIASHLVEYLLAMEAQVRAFVRYNSREDADYLREIKNRAGLEILPGDVLNFRTADQAVKGMQVVCHLGAVISIPYSYHYPIEVVETNVNGTLNVLLACQKWGVEKVVTRPAVRYMGRPGRCLSQRATRYRGSRHIRRAK